MVLVLTRFTAIHFLILGLIILPFQLSAQSSRHSVDINFGYNFNAPFTYSDNSYELVNIPEDLANSNFTEVSAALRNGGYGKGMSVAVNYHYNLKDNLRLNGGVRYHKMPQEEFVWRAEKSGDANLTRMQLNYNERNASSIQAELGVGLGNKLSESWSLNADIGFLVGMANMHIYMLSEKEYDEYGIHKSYTDMTVQFVDGVMLGFATSLSVEKQITNRVDIFAGFDFRLVNHQQRHAHFTNAFFQGSMEIENFPLRKEDLSDKSVRGVRTKFMEIPLLYQNRPFSSYGLKLGMSYNL